jgi:Spy/CpxP family protein refolding chaperone
MKKLGMMVMALCLTFATAAWSQPADQSANAPKPAADQHKGGPKHGLGALKLTDEQKKQVKKLDVELRRQEIDQRAKVEKAELELHELLSADQPEQSAIEKQIRVVADLKAEQWVLKVNHWFAVNKLLTTEQQKVWKENLGRGAGLRDGGREGKFHGEAAPCEGNDQRQKGPQGGAQRQGPSPDGDGPFGDASQPDQPDAGE